MANYTKLTDFAAKDALPKGNAAKIVKGTEIDDEFAAIETAIASKPNTNDVDAQIAAVITATKESLYPVGSVYTNASSSTNPNSLLGFGTWVRFGEGKVLVSQDSSDTAFDTLGETGGSKDAVVVSHSHTGSAASAGSHAHNMLVGPSSSASSGIYGGYPQTSTDGGSANRSGIVQSAGAHTHSVTVNSSGESGTNKNLQPYIVVYMWQRTA